MPLLPYYFLTAVFGAIVGSFLNVVILRDANRRSILTGRSECMYCSHELRWFELIPIVSFVIQGGRCRVCKKRLVWLYPIGEAITALLAVFAVWYGYAEHGSWVLAAGVFLALAAFFVMSSTDLRNMEIRPEYAMFAALVAGLTNGLTSTLAWKDIGLGILAGAGSILILSYGWKVLTGKLGMGEGDVWIAGAVGAVVGYPLIFAALFGAVSVGAIVGLIILARARKMEGVEMPFGPYLALGCIIALVWGPLIIQWYRIN